MTEATIEQEKVVEKQLEELKFVKLKIPRLIPREIIESVKGRTFTADQFYTYQDSQVKNPYNHLFALINESKKIVGYFWAEMNLLDNSMFVNTFSISKEYWDKGQAIEKAINLLKELVSKTRASRVFWITTNEKFFLKKGFKKSKNVLMEYAVN